MSRPITKPQFALAVLKSRRVELDTLKKVIRNEGEPGNAGEMVSINYVDELIDDRIAEIDEEIASIYKKIEEAK